MSPPDLPIDLSRGADEPPPPPSRRWAGLLRDIGVTVLLGAAIWVGVGWLRAPSLPDPAPDFTLESLTGERVSLASLRGQTVVLNFWATWCGPCRVELPELVAFAEGNPEVPVLFVAMDGTADALRAFAAEHGLPPERVLRATKQVDADYRVDTLPTTVIVAPDGDVRTAHVGIVARPWLWAFTRW